MSMNTPLRLKTFPGALYSGDGTLLAGDGPELTDELAKKLPHKAFIGDRPVNDGVALLKRDERLSLATDL